MLHVACAGVAFSEQKFGKNCKRNLQKRKPPTQARMTLERFRSILRYLIIEDHERAVLGFGQSLQENYLHVSNS
jgi:hypothetical protein